MTWGWIWVTMRFSASQRACCHSGLVGTSSPFPSPQRLHLSPLGCLLLLPKELVVKTVLVAPVSNTGPEHACFRFAPCCAGLPATVLSAAL